SICHFFDWYSFSIIALRPFRLPAFFLFFSYTIFGTLVCLLSYSIFYTLLIYCVFSCFQCIPFCLCFAHCECVLAFGQVPMRGGSAQRRQCNYTTGEGSSRT